MNIRVFIVAALGIYICAVLQQSVSPRLAIGGVAPDFGLAFICIFSIFARRLHSTICGFFDGLFQGALAGVNLTHYILSRSLVGFFGGLGNSIGVQPSLISAVIITGTGTVASQMLLFFLAPPSGIGRFLGDTIGTAMYNGVLAVPVYALLRRVLAAPTR